MEAKNTRLDAIISILKKGRIDSQERLLDELLSRGCGTTQATLSRDLKSLGVAKQPDGRGGYIYVLPDQRPEANPVLPAEIELAARGILSITFSGNIGVVQTLSGYASSVAEVMDRLDIKEILGTVAGDNTIFFVLKPGIGINGIIKKITEKIPALKEKIL